MQEKYKNNWEAICPEHGKNKLLWLIAELGEVIDIVKKDGTERIMTEDAVRTQMVEKKKEIILHMIFLFV